MKAVRKLIQGNFGKKLKGRGISNLILHVDNEEVFHITKSFVSVSQPLIRELRRLKLVLSELNVHVRAEWLPSDINNFADALSRRFPNGDLLIRRKLRRSVADGMKAPLDAFKYRPLGDHPFIRRKLMIEGMMKDWSDGQAQLLCPPVDLLMVTVNKLARTKAPAILLIPDWPLQAWNPSSMRLDQRWRGLPLPPEEV